MSAERLALVYDPPADQTGSHYEERVKGPMPTTHYAHYFSSMSLRRQLRWAVAAVLIRAGLAIVATAVKLLPEHHPARPYLGCRTEVLKTAVLPALGCGLPTWAARLGRGVAVALLALILALTVIGTTRTSKHIHNRHQEQATDLFRPW